MSESCAEIHVLIVSDGANGGDSNDITSTRLKESRNSFRLLNATCSSLGFSDGNVEYGKVLISAIEKENDSFRPNIVITQYANEDSAEHQDHIAVFRAVKNVCFRRDNVKMLLAAEPMNLAASFVPNTFYNITGQFDLKLKAISMHQSQKQRFYMKKTYQEVRSARWADRAFREEAETSRYCEAFQLEKLIC